MVITGVDTFEDEINQVEEVKSRVETADSNTIGYKSSHAFRLAAFSLLTIMSSAAWANK